MSHKSEKLEQYIGKFVNIKFRPVCGTTRIEKGVLHHNTKGWRPYKLQTKKYDFIFSKSEVVKIEEVET